MSAWPRYPAICQINVAHWLNELSQRASEPVTLANLPTSELERLAHYKIDAVWLVGIWQRSPFARTVALARADLAPRLREAIPDYDESDIMGSPYAVYAYDVDPAFGNAGDLIALRERLRTLGLLLVLDFVPNHVAADHPWLASSPHRFVRCDQGQLDDPSDRYFIPTLAGTNEAFAHGRDPNFAPWRDTAQLDYRRAETRNVMIESLASIAQQCDGIRCDMAMLVTHDIFLRTWGGQFDSPKMEFWAEAISAIKSRYPNCLMLAEVYWDLEYSLQRQGFDYTYDKRLYDALLSGDGTAVTLHLRAALSYQRRLARFIENHDEQAAASLGSQRSRALAALAFTLPGLRLVQDTQLLGGRVRVPVELRRRPRQHADPQIERFYKLLLRALSHPAFHRGTWLLIESRAAHAENDTCRSIVAYLWVLENDSRLVVVNLSSSSAQCYVPLTLPGLDGRAWRLRDLLSESTYLRHGDDLYNPGLYLDLPGHGHHMFELLPVKQVMPKGFRQCGSFRQHTRGIHAIAWSPNGELLASAGEDRTILVWQSTECRTIKYLDGHLDTVSSLAWSPSTSEHLLASGSHDRTVRLWDVDTKACIRTLTRHRNCVVTIAWSPDGQAIASGSLDGIVVVQPLRPDAAPRVLDIPGAANSVSWSPGGHMLAVGTGDGSVLLWEDRDGGIQRSFQIAGWVSAVAWAPDGDVIAAGSGLGSIHIWNAQSGQIVSTLAKHTDRILALAFVDGGRLLASKSADNTVRLWSVTDWRELATFDEFGVFLGGLASHPTESVLATRDDKEHAVRLWKLGVGSGRGVGVRMEASAAEYDVFLAYNSRDRDAVSAIEKRLRRRRIRTWFDKRQMPPAAHILSAIEHGLRSSATVALFIGPGGLGEWQRMEYADAIDEYVGQSRPVIPVVLPNVQPSPTDLPRFVRQFVWVRFEGSIRDKTALDELTQAIRSHV